MKRQKIQPNLLTLIIIFELLILKGSVNSVFALSEGYILSAGFWGYSTELLDKKGNVVFSWAHQSQNGYSCYLMENGHLVRGCCAPQNIRVSSGAAPRQGMIEEVDLNNNIVWCCTLATDTTMMHHDFKILPNGNILGVSFIKVSKQRAIAAGIDSNLFNTSGGIGGSSTSMEAEKIFELKPDRTGGGKHTILWEWNMLDHVSPSSEHLSHPELFGGYIAPLLGSYNQWVHLNGIDYNPSKNLILFSSRVFSEVYIIEKPTSSQMASSHSGGTYGKGGDLLYRWGHPSNYLSPVTYDSATVFTKKVLIPKKESHPNDIIYCLHSPTWIPEGYRGAGNIMFFHNNVNASMNKLGESQVIEVNPWKEDGKLYSLAPSVVTEPLNPTWIYSPDSMFSASMSTAIRMKNGNTCVHEAYPGGNQSGNASRIREVDPSGNIVGEIIYLRKWQRVKYYDRTVRDTVEKDSLMNINAAKIMYYPEDYSGIKEVLKVKAINRYNKGKIYEEVPFVRIKNNMIFLEGIKDIEICIFTFDGRTVYRNFVKDGSRGIPYPTSKSKNGAHIITIKKGKISRSYKIIGI